MKKIILPLLLFANIAYAQNCDDLIKENAYLKNTLNITTGVKSTIIDKLTFTPVSVINFSKNNTAKIEVLVTNVGKEVINIPFLLDETDVIDLQGNSYKILKAQVGKNEIEKVTQFSILGYILNVDVPTKIIYTIEGIPENVQFIKAVQIGFLGGSQGTDHLSALVKDIKINRE